MTFSLFAILCSQENQRSLFKEVVQFNPAKLQKGGGSGLGLYSELVCSNIRFITNQLYLTL